VPPEEFAAFLAGLAERGYVGANVTIPHKEAALARSTPDARAKAVGAANTLWRDGTTLRSTNTDVEGLLGNLDASAAGWDRGLQNALVLGAGGSARAVLFGLIERGIARIHLVNRTMTAQALAQRFGAAVVAPWEGRSMRLGSAGLLVNSTSLGMKPAAARDRRCAAAGGRVVADPSMCRWSRRRSQRRAPGLATADGSACCCTRRCAVFAVVRLGRRDA
jgi:shikimate dehydrogenase